VTVTPDALTQAIQLADVSVFVGPRRVLDAVTVAVAPGELVAVVGENGAGKTTLVQCVSGALVPDAGTVTVCGRQPAAARRGGQLAVVWQDLALCDNLSVTANIFLGREPGGGFLARRGMHARAAALLDRLGLGVKDLGRRAGELSGGERQAVAIARALLTNPRVLVLDEPTSALGVNETRRFDRLLRSLRSTGVAVLLVSHRIEQVFGLADRVVALRHGRMVADVTTVEAHADDVVAMMAGLSGDSAARRHLARLSSLVDQLAEVEPSASLPMIVSALSTAFGQQQLCVHIAAPDGDLVLGASVGIAPNVLHDLRRVRVGPGGGSIGEAASTGLAVVVEDLRHAPNSIGAGDGPVSMWSVPIQGGVSVYGVLSGLADAPGRPQDDQIRLASVYASLAATAIERERLLHNVARRNRVLESLRGVLDGLAGPTQLPASLRIALEALARGLGADGTCLAEVDGRGGEAWVHSAAATGQSGSAAGLSSLLARAAPGSDWPGGGARTVAPLVKAVPFEVGDRRFLLGAQWSTSARVTGDGIELLESAARSLRLAVERDIAERARAEADGLRRVSDLQRDFIHRLSHELRTPLTAITGYASTLSATDVTWDAASQRRFLAAIATESARMGRLVGDLLDASAISSGVLSIQPDWCDPPAILEAAVTAVPGGAREVRVEIEAVPPVWADHDRLEQVLVNLLDNALRHGAAPVTLRMYRIGEQAAIEVADAGRGIPPRLRQSVLEPYVRGDTSVPGAGLGLAICKGIVDAHHGLLEIVDVPAGTVVRVTLPLDARPSDAS
jgi:signal transduction histidine kinase/ABC-type multidrug transport system ATPase subunit